MTAWGIIVGATTLVIWLGVMIWSLRETRRDLRAGRNWPDYSRKD